MSIIDDQNELRKQNIQFLKNYVKELFKNFYDKLGTKYTNIISSNVLDETDKKEIKKCLVNEYSKIKENRISLQGYKLEMFKGITIKNNRFNYDIKEFLNSAITTQLTEIMYPPLEKQTSRFDFLDWSKRIRTTAESVYIKHLVQTINTPTQNFNNKIFETYESEQFFNYCVSEWLNDIEKPLTAISCIFQKLWYKSEKEHPFKIICDTLKFTDFWNDNVIHSHNYKIGRNFKTSYLKSSSELSKTVISRFDNILNAFTRS